MKTYRENMVVKIIYEDDIPLPDHITLFRGSDHVCCVKDDGVQPDAIADDYAYTSCIQQDPNSFAQQRIDSNMSFLASG